jgi:hypothetical protein
MAVIDEGVGRLLGLPLAYPSVECGQVYAEFISLIGELEAVFAINRTRKRREQCFLHVPTLDRVLRLHTFSVGGTGETIAREYG